MSTRPWNKFHAMLRTNTVRDVIERLEYKFDEPIGPDTIIPKSRNVTVLEAVMLWDLYDDWAYELEYENYHNRSRRYVNARNILFVWLHNMGIDPMEMLSGKPTPTNLNPLASATKMKDLPALIAINTTGE